MIRPKGLALKIAKESVPGLSLWSLKKSKSDYKRKPDVTQLQLEDSAANYIVRKGMRS